MAELDTLIKIVAEGLKTMAQGVEKLAEKVEDLGKSVPEKKAKPKRKAPAKPSKKVYKKASKKAVPKKEKPATAADTAFAIIKRYRKGVDTATLMEKTGYNKKN